jgi:hypothetical protein
MLDVRRIQAGLRPARIAQTMFRRDSPVLPGRARVNTPKNNALDLIDPAR